MKTVELRLNILLLAWVFLLVAPGALVALGFFGHVDATTHLSSSMAITWLVGCLAAFAIFFWISRIVEPGFAAWFGASLLPWAIDWTTPVSPLFWLPWGSIAIAIVLKIALGKRGDGVKDTNTFEGAMAIGDKFPLLVDPRNP